MGRFSSGIGRTGKQKRQAAGGEPGAVPTPPTEALPKRSHKKKAPTPEERAQARHERVAAFLLSDAGQQRPPDQNICDCVCRGEERDTYHDVFCPMYMCYAFEIGCCQWEAVARPNGLVARLPCNCMRFDHAAWGTKANRALLRGQGVREFCWCGKHLRPDAYCGCWDGFRAEGEWMGWRGRIVGHGKITNLPPA